MDLSWVKLQASQDNQNNQDAHELSMDCHSQRSEYLSKRDTNAFIMKYYEQMNE